MKINGHDIADKTFIIAEVGNNHEGDYSLAERMVGLAAEAGVDSVKFQTIRADRLVDGADPARLKTLRSFELSYDQFEKLARVCEREGVQFLSTPFDLESARHIAPLVGAFKIASGDVGFTPLLETVAGFGKPVIMSRGISDAGEVRGAVECIQGVWKDAGILDPGLALLHCVAEYPTAPERANLLAIRGLAAEFGLPIGYSDHTLGIEAAALSVALGARIVEKHFTLDHNHSAFRDHQLSADPDEMRELVRRVREAEKLLGHGSLEPEGERFNNAEAFSRSLCVAEDTPEGTILTEAHVAFLRPGNGLSPSRINEVLGKVVRRSMKKGEQIAIEQLN
ncbi:N,N'-diacetyllegionaminic acid synthase [Pseudodesulfovibrio hydrargyri]|uniref:N,N'-diacetyllegionaminic acid synthase n=1 Tax=Pseudodesulfovibrio hydrargyri TaxID=2125990 RepID=A0A1J5MTV5_9BACT|nr:N-acetylneuraminate synthase family protein [Pseudodesulfovibrio hydrargyri]OIQ50062.1 N,N'-diacetyllegionaminic acid synthase [Pseudodesulfovibrio hydrargyri]